MSTIPEISESGTTMKYVVARADGTVDVLMRTTRLAVTELRELVGGGFTAEISMTPELHIQSPGWGRVAMVNDDGTLALLRGVITEENETLPQNSFFPELRGNVVLGKSDWRGLWGFSEREARNVMDHLRRKLRVVPNISVGSIVVAKHGSGVCSVGEIGVCYEVYTLENRPGYSFIFESGRCDGFSPDDVALFLDVTGRVCQSVAGYAFQNVGKLAEDFRAGRFAAAFPMQVGSA